MIIEEQSHDSSGFCDTDFYDQLKETGGDHFSSKHFILGDYAYVIESFIIHLMIQLVKAVQKMASTFTIQVQELLFNVILER